MVSRRRHAIPRQWPERATGEERPSIVRARVLVVDDDPHMLSLTDRGPDFEGHVVHVMRLRDTLEAGARGRLVHTIHGAGYSLRRLL